MRPKLMKGRNDAPGVLLAEFRHQFALDETQFAPIVAAQPPARDGRSFSPTTGAMRDATVRVDFRDDEPSVSRDGALDRRDDDDSKVEEAGGKDVTREMVVSCVARAGSRRALNEKVDAYLARLTHVPLDGRGIANKLEVIASVCPGVRVLYLCDNKITKMAGLARLSRLTHLHLQNNRLTSIEGLGKCEHLEKLYVDGNCLREIKGLEACVNLRALHASNQRRTTNDSEADASLRFDQASLDAVAGALTHLDVSSCRFLDAKKLGSLAKLETANLGNCGLESLAELEPALALCSRLKHVDVRGNPLAKDPRHEDRVAVLGEGLQTVNGREVTARERAFLTRLERRREARRDGKGFGKGSTRAGGPESSLRRVNSHQHHQQHLETIANLGEGTVDHGFDYPGHGGNQRDAGPVSPRSPGDLLLPGSPGATPMASTAGMVPGSWRDFPSPTGASREIGLQGTLDGTGTFHDRLVGGGASGRASPGMASPRAAPGMLSPGMRNAAPYGDARRRAARRAPAARGAAATSGGANRGTWDAALDGVGGTAYVPPRRQTSVEGVPSEADVTSRFEVPDE